MQTTQLQKPYTNGINGNTAPSEKQKQYMKNLARTAGATVDLSQIHTKQDASRLIDKLKRLADKQKMHKKPQQSREKREQSFALATTLVYNKHCDPNHNPTKSPEFWKEVREVFTKYEQQQQAALSEGFVSAETV